GSCGAAPLRLADATAVGGVRGVDGTSYWGVVTSVSIDGVRFCVSWPGQVVTFARLAEVSYTISDTKQGRKDLMTATPQEVTGDGAGDGRFGGLPRRPR